MNEVPLYGTLRTVWWRGVALRLWAVASLGLHVKVYYIDIRLVAVLSLATRVAL